MNLYYHFDRAKRREFSNVFIRIQLLTSFNNRGGEYQIFTLYLQQ